MNTLLYVQSFSLGHFIKLKPGTSEGCIVLVRVILIIEFWLSSINRIDDLRSILNNISAKREAKYIVIFVAVYTLKMQKWFATSYLYCLPNLNQNAYHLKRWMTHIKIKLPNKRLNFFITKKIRGISVNFLSLVMFQIPKSCRIKNGNSLNLC